MSDRHLSVSPGTVHRTSLRGVLICTPGSDRSHLLTPPGDVVWAALLDGCTEADLVVALAERFSADAAQIRTDVATLVDSLVEMGAVSSVPGPEPPGPTVAPDRS